MTEKELRLTKSIHNLVRGNLTWEDSWELLSKVMESNEWIEYWEIETMLYELFSKKV